MKYKTIRNQFKKINKKNKKDRPSLKIPLSVNNNSICKYKIACQKSPHLKKTIFVKLLIHKLKIL
jgi:hypothetical protein